MAFKLLSRVLGAIAVILLACGWAFAQNGEQDAYCAYVSEQAMSERNLLRAPDALAGFTQPNTGTPAQAYWGVTGSLANVVKGSRTMDAAHKSCASYRATNAATLDIQYAVQRLEKEALLHRMELLQRAIDELDQAIIQRNAQLVEVHTVTSPMLYAVQSVRSKLVSDQLKTELKLAAIYVPEEAAGAPLKQLILEKQNREAEAQRAAALANRQNTWDVLYEAGGRQPLTPLFQHTPQPYGEITFRYNFGSSHNNTHLEKAATAFTEWKTLQDGEVLQNAKLLEQQISRSIVVYQAQLGELRKEEMEIDNNLERLVGIDTTAALAFGNQLGADKLLLRVEIQDTDFRLQNLQQYLKTNF